MVALDYAVTITWDGAATAASIPSNVAALQTIKNIVSPSNLRLKHITIKTDDVAYTGKMLVYLSNTGTYSHAWGFSRYGGEWLGVDTDVIVELTGRTYGNLGLAYFWANTVPTNADVMVVGLYFEVV